MERSRVAEHDEYFRFPEPDAVRAAHDAGLHEYAAALADTRYVIGSSDEAVRRESEFAEEDAEEERQFLSAQTADFQEELEAAFLSAEAGDDEERGQ